MATNKFATMVRRNTNRTTLVLIYAVLEWNLIFLLLLNSLFSYLIIKFADYFGLKPPCPWCSRIDHFFERRKRRGSRYRDLLCQSHATEISQLGFCSNHLKLAESDRMCEDCSSSKREFESWLVGNKVIENGEVNFKCSCCGVKLSEGKTSSPYSVIQPSFDDLEIIPKGNIDVLIETHDNLDRSGSDFLIVQAKDMKGFRRKRENGIRSDATEPLVDNKKEEAEEISPGFLEEDSNTIRVCQNSLIKCCNGEGTSSENFSQHLEFFIDHSGNQLVPIELIDSISEESQVADDDDEDHEYDDYQEATTTAILAEKKAEEPLSPVPEEQESLSSKQNTNTEFIQLTETGERLPSGDEKEPEFLGTSKNTEDSVFVLENSQGIKFPMLDLKAAAGSDDSIFFCAEESDFFAKKVAVGIANESPNLCFNHENEQDSAIAGGEETDFKMQSVHDESSHMVITENEAEVSIGTEIPELELTDDIEPQEQFCSDSLELEETATSSSNFQMNVDFVAERSLEEEAVELRAIAVEAGENMADIEDERIPDTPNSLDCLNQLHKKLLLDRKESGAEESLDGSAISELDYGDPVSTAERLKSVLRAERKALNALYSELEEERSASAVAANQTMAMINRLQEEKAAMQMEALQYQRMMEEQSEYDQEALQLLNELMVKREKEKQELERELEAYKKRVSGLEKAGASWKSKEASSTSSEEDGDEKISVDLNRETKDENRFACNEDATPIGAVANLEESLEDFEDGRVSILEQLKALEEKLFSLTDEEDQLFEDVRPIGDYHDKESREVNGIVNGLHSRENHQEKKITGSVKARRLLPLFDAISTESEDGILNGAANDNENENGLYSYGPECPGAARFELEKRRIDMEEEMDQLYRRLHALEADKEFLKHCVGSLNKGDRGMWLLQEILQHLRDLRSV